MAFTALALHDINDTQAFVAANVQRSRVILRDHDEREELLAEGVAILLELAAKYEPHRPGYAKPGSFAGYAAKYLPGRMRDAYYALHPEHRPARDDEGRSVYVHGQRPMSLDHEDMPQLAATYALAGCDERVPAVRGWDPSRPIVSQALALVRPEDGGFLARRLVDLLDEGYGTDEIASRLRISRREVARVQGAVGSAVWSVQRAEAA